MAHAQTLEQVGAKHPHKTDVVHPLHQLRFRRTGANGGDVLHRGVGQGHPGGIAVRECRFFLEKLPKQCCVALRRAVVAGFIQLPGKREQGVLVLAEGIAQMSQYLGHADQLRRPAVLAGQGAEQLLLLGKLQIISCIFQIRGRENIRQFLPEVTIGQPGERPRNIHEGEDAAGSALHLGQQRQVHRPRVHPLQQAVHRIAGRGKGFNRFS